MNKAQRTVLVLAAVVVGLMVLFPPYVMNVSGHGIFRAGYGFLLDLPISSAHQGVVNVATLFVQIFCVLVIAALSFFAVKR